MGEFMTNKPKAKKRITQKEYSNIYNDYDRRFHDTGIENVLVLDNLDLRGVEIDWDNISSMSLSGAVLTGVSLTG